ncbi:MAG: sugar O-acyltransferase (sialic acid O-acetyltransferase NeuD family) [Roseivirga sp.]|jgi:sugar O-acyltransferase (sialic acid O-acetyltransferase NeuD family)
MEEDKTLHVLGCVPSLLNILFELAEEANGINSFRVLQNMEVDTSKHFNPLKEWNVEIFELYKTKREFNPQGKYALSVVGTNAKKIIYDTFKILIQMEDEQFINLIHPTSYISRSVHLNYGLQIEPLTTIAACTSIGFGVNIKRNCNIGHHCEIEDFVTINPGVTLSSFVKIGSQTMIGSGASIKDGISIGKNAVIGIGSVVVKDIPDNSIAYGNPCVVHKINA